MRVLSFQLVSALILLIASTGSPGQTAPSPGSLDTRFDPTRGGCCVGPASAAGELFALARQPDGKLIVGGHFAGIAGVLRRHIARIFPDGRLDETFKPGLGFDGRVFSIALQTEGDLLVGGSFSVFDTNHCFSLVRLRADGSMDESFRPELEAYSSQPSVGTIVVQPDGKILIGGSFSSVNGIARRNLARLNPDGTLDSAFVPPSSSEDPYQRVVNLALLPGGKVLVGGRFLGDRTLLCRLNPDGSLDPAFASQLTGYELVQFAVRSDGKIYAAGPFDFDRPGWYSSSLVLVNADGTIDRSFSVDLDNTGFYCFSTVAIQPGDHLLVAGWFGTVNGLVRRGLARVTPNGQVDQAFDPADTLLHWSPPSGPHGSVFTSLEPDGPIWIAGSISLTNGSEASLVRLRQDGRLDKALCGGDGGLVIAGHETSVAAMALTKEGNIYIGGAFASFNHQPRPNLARLLPDGSLDPSFVPAGLPAFPIGLFALQPDGKLLAAGSSELVRLNPDGNIDPQFDGTPGERLGMRFRCMALQTDGRILIGGEFAGGLARLSPDGSIDTSFTPPHLPAYDGDGVNALAVQPDHKILYGGNGAIALQRLHPDGSLDSTFHFEPTNTFAIRRILIQPDRRILVALDGSPSLVRLQPNGAVDGTFNGPAGESAEALAIAPDGYVLAVLRSLDGAHRIRVCRLDPDGRVDSSFNARLGPQDWHSSAGVILLQPDGQILLGGNFTSVNGIPVDGLARLHNRLPEPHCFVHREFAPGGEVHLAVNPPPHVRAHAVEDQTPAGWAVTAISHDGLFDTRTGKVKFGPFYDSQPRILSYRALPPPWIPHCAAGVFCFVGHASADGITSIIGGQQCRTVARFFPADVNPADQRIEIGELTAYAAAWRQASTWLCHTGAIPIDYVTRAAYLWRGGECYEVAPLLTNEPLWWVSCGSISKPAPGQASPSSAPWVTRQIPSSFIPGQPVTVTLDIAPPIGATALAIEELLPSGWTVTDIPPYGAFDPAASRIRWGPFFGSTGRSLSYTVTPPPHARGLAPFQGIGSLDGVSGAIAGPGSMAEACRLLPAPQTPTGQFRFSLQGRVGARFLVETSSDLVVWTSWATLSNSVGTVSFSAPIQINSPPRFFRASIAR